ncbi:MAG TPA: hypothetical protein VHK90_08140, partial [Thermoanaerobaculia bacterium]|nr:hypothetical protein [Thermoanaerobaculia bacterium]
SNIRGCDAYQSIACTPPEDAVCIAGERDPIPDRTCARVITVPGAHACIVSHPEAVCEAAGFSRPTSSPAG